MYETILKQIRNNYEIPNDIIQLIYDELNKKHKCAIMIHDEIERLKATKSRQLCGIKYFMIEPISDESHCFIYKTINNRSRKMSREMYNVHINLFNDKYD